MNDQQLAHFVYWLQEHPNLRGLLERDLRPGQKMLKIISLKKEFFKKYPDGKLTGWNNDVNL